jgi:hypothetical protein
MRLRNDDCAGLPVDHDLRRSKPPPGLTRVEAIIAYRIEHILEAIVSAPIVRGRLTGHPTRKLTDCRVTK